MNPKDVPVKSRYFYNEVSVYFLLIYANKGGTAKHKPRPFMGLGFFVFKKRRNS
jgi:hypothetical protein